MKRRWAVLLACVVAGIVIAIVWPREREPEYGGKRLSEWANLYEVSFNLGDGATAVELAERREAVEAAHHVRDRILVYAVRMIRYEKPEWKQRVERVMELNDAGQWRAAADNQMRTVAPSARPLHQPG